MAPPSVGVATPMKMVPSTRKMSASGGTMTKVTSCAMFDRRPSLRKRLASASEKEIATASDIVRMTKSAPALTLVRYSMKRAASSPEAPARASRLRRGFAPIRRGPRKRSW